MMRHVHVLLSLLVLLLAAPSFAASPVVTDADAAKARFEALLGAVGGDPDADFTGKVPQFFASALVKRAGTERLAGIFSQLANDGWGGKTELMDAKYEDGVWKIGARSQEGMEATFALGFVDDDSGLITQFGVEAGMPVEVPVVKPAAFASTIDAYLDAHANELSGTVIVAHDGTPLVQRTFGLANRDSGRGMTLDTPINLGSMNKMITGVAIGQLVEVGKLRWNDTVGKFLPDYPNKTVREQVTIAELLNHTAGIPSYWNDAYDKGKDAIRTQQQFLHTIKGEPLTSAPGARWEYSNGGPVILGRIIEVVSGQDYYDYVRKHIYAPLGMTHTDHYLRNMPAPPFATGYWAGEDPRADGKLVSNANWLGLSGSAAGGGYASAPDLLKFAEALRTARILKHGTLETMWRDREVDGQANGYGYLFGTGVDNGHRWVGHTGGAPGINAFFRLYPEDGYTVIVLSNIDNGAIAAGRWIGALIENNTMPDGRRGSAPASKQEAGAGD